MQGAVERALRAASATAELVARDVGDDGQQPRAELAAPVAADGAVGADKRLLGRVLRRLGRAEVAERKPISGVLVAEDKLVEGVERATGGAPGELGVLAAGCFGQMLDRQCPVPPSGRA